MELERLNFTDYKNDKIKSYLKNEKLLFVFNFGDEPNNMEKSKKKKKIRYPVTKFLY